MNAPDTEYAYTDEGVCVAYKVFGDASRDLVFSPGMVTHLEVLLELPSAERFFRRLARTFRVMVYDKQGTGMSDRVATLPDLDARMDDITAVMRAVGSTRATYFGPTQGGALSSLFATTYPERTDALVLYGGMARVSWAPDYPWGTTEEEAEEGYADVREAWGTAPWAERFAFGWGAESRQHDPEFVRWLARMMRFAATPTSALAFFKVFDATDVRGVLPSIGAPTLLMHRTGQDEKEEVEYTASLIPRARVVELPADDWSLWMADPEPLVSEIEAFVDDVEGEESAMDRMLATVLFTDIVGSTQRATELGDRDWRTLVERHHRTVRALLARYRGKEVDTAGDGFFATFDGPARAVRCALAIVDALSRRDIDVRIGVHTGEITTIDGKAGGVAVVIGARASSVAGAGQIVATSTVRDLTAGSGLAFDDAGEHELKGIPDVWRLYRVLVDDS